MRQKMKHFTVLQRFVVPVVAAGFCIWHHLLFITGVLLAAVAWYDGSSYGAAFRASAGVKNPELAGNSWLWAILAIICFYAYFKKGVRLPLPGRRR